MGKLLFVDERDDPGQKALDEVQDVAYGLYDETLGGKDVAVENHLPLDAPFGREEGGSVHRELKSLLWAEREATLGAPRGRRLDGEEHAGISRFGFLPTVLLDKLIFEG